MLRKIKFILNRLIAPKLKYNFPIEPASFVFGFDRGIPIDRYYLEKFISKHSSIIKGKTFEIGDDFYTKKYGTNIVFTDILNGDPNIDTTYDGDLTNIASLRNLNNIDCVIATQVINFIYDFDSALLGISKLLQANGFAIISAAGISQISQYDAERWGDYWRFTPQSFSRALSKHFEIVDLEYFGNYNTAISFLSGLSANELNCEVLDQKDINYSIILCACVKLKI